MRAKIKYPLLILIFASATACCQCSLNVERFKETDNFIINVNNPLGSKINLLIKNSEDKTLWQESVMFVEKLKKIIFLGSLQQGKYKIEVFNGHESKSADIEITGTDETVHPENGKSLIVGFSKGKNDAQSIDIIIQNKLDKSVSLKLYKEKTLVTEENLGTAELIRKLLKLPEADKAEYIVKIGTKDNVYLYKTAQHSLANKK